MKYLYNIAIIGAGQLGSRHLQGLKKADTDMSVFVVDTSPQSLEVAKARYLEVDNNPCINSIEYLADVNMLPIQLDLVIIATNSIPRANLTKQLLSAKQVKNIVFEKFLFPSFSDYASIGKLLKDHNTRAWVNCTRRYFSFYKELQSLLKNAAMMKMYVSGNNWGLACNSIHFIDLFAMLTGRQDYVIDTSLLENIVDSKRSGYIELTGTISGKSTYGDYGFELTSKESINTPCFLIITEKYQITIFEQQKKAYIETSDGNRIEKEIDIYYQSGLTGIMSEQILQKGQSDLPLYEESANLHTRFLKPVIEFYNQKMGKDQDFCPIT